MQWSGNANSTTKSTGEEHTEAMNAYQNTGSLYIFTCLHYLMYCSLVYIYKIIEYLDMTHKCMARTFGQPLS